MKRSAALDEGFMDSVNGSRVHQMDITRIIPNPAQPRKDMDQAKLQNLAENIKKNGIIQPITVRPRGDSYLIVAGERRWRAAQMAGLRSIPVIVRSEDDDNGPSIDETALIENMQREDLNLIDEVEAINNLRDRGKSVEEITVITGRSATHIKRAKRVHAFFMHLMAGGFADYSVLAEIASRYGLSVIEKAARVAEETDDLEKGLSLLQSGASAGELDEKAQIELAAAEEKQEVADQPVIADKKNVDLIPPDEPPSSVLGTEQERVFRDEPALSAPDPSPDRENQVSNRRGEPDDDFLDEISFSSKGKKTEEPVKNDTKYTQNAESFPGEDNYSGDSSYNEMEENSHDQQKDAKNVSDEGPATLPEEDDREAISGKMLLKKLGVVKRAIEDIAPAADMQFKVRKSDRELLANLVKDVEFLMPAATRVISAIEAHLASLK